MITRTDLHEIQSISVGPLIELSNGIGYMRKIKFSCRGGHFEIAAFAETAEAVDIDVPANVSETPAFLRKQA